MWLLNKNHIWNVFLCRLYENNLCKYKYATVKVEKYYAGGRGNHGQTISTSSGRWTIPTDRRNVYCIGGGC